MRYLCTAVVEKTMDTCSSEPTCYVGDMLTWEVVDYPFDPISMSEAYTIARKEAQAVFGGSAFRINVSVEARG